MTSLAAFLYTSADCVLNYISQQQQRRGNHGDEIDDVITLPGITLCNVNPLRLDVFDDVSKLRGNDHSSPKGLQSRFWVENCLLTNMINTLKGIKQVGRLVVARVSLCVLA